MKHIITVLLFFVSSTVAIAQTNESTIERLENMANSSFDKGDFSNSLALRQKQIGLMDKDGHKKDSVYILKMVQMAKCYSRLEQYDKAVSEAQEIVKLYETNVSNHDLQYANFLDNLAYYQMKEGKDKEGLPNCSKALKIYEQLQVNNFDMAIILSRMAEISNVMNNNSDAIKYELRSLNIISNLYGKHSKDYIDEAYYLKKYYDANGDKDKAEKLDTQLETLQKELDDGEVDLPEAVEFTSAAVAHSHNNDMQRCINYLFNHYVNAPKMDDAANYIFMWSVVSGDCNIIIGDDFSKLLLKPETKIYMFAYIAALSEYALATGRKDFSLDAYSYMMSKLCKYYSVNKEYTGEVKLFEKYISAYNKGKGKYEELVKKDFEKNSKQK